MASINCILLYFVNCIVLCKIPSFFVAVESLPPQNSLAPVKFKSSYGNTTPAFLGEVSKVFNFVGRVTRVRSNYQKCKKMEFKLSVTQLTEYACSHNDWSC